MKKKGELFLQLEEAGKLHKVNIYTQIIKQQMKTDIPQTMQSYKAALKIYREYLEFDPIPPVDTARDMQYIYLLLFGISRKEKSQKLFHQLYSDFSILCADFPDPELMAKIYSHLNFLFWMDNKIDTSLEYGHKSLEILSECDNNKILPGRYSNIGYLYECIGDYDKAEEFFQKGIQFGLKVNSDEVLCLSYCGFGRMNLRTGNYTMAINYFLEALKFFPQKDEDYISVVNNLGVSLSSIHKYHEAISYFSQFINKETKEQHPFLYLDLLMNCANSHLAINQLDTAEKQLQEALDEAVKRKRNDVTTGILINLGNLEYKKEKYQKAIEYYQKSILYNNDIDDKNYAVFANLGLGKVYLNLNNLSLAKQFLHRSLTNAELMQNTQDMIHAHEFLAEIYEQENDLANALIHIKKLKKLQLKENENKFALDLKQLKLKYKTRDKILSQHEYTNSAQLISRELAAHINSPIIGQSQQLRKVVDHAMIAAQNPNTPVLITGESGTGKEIIARLIHYASDRRKKPFISVNTAAFTDSLIESAFFGSEKGAYTGADKRKIGYFEAAAKGSLFLDEIGDMPAAMQVKFLRVIENRVLNRIGSLDNITLDFRLISATNKDLHDFSQKNQFRFDLYNRINTIEIHIPPLRERTDDIPLLINYYLEYYAVQLNRTKPLLTRNALKTLLDYNYPGNVRELKNIIHRTMIFSQKDLLHNSDIMHTFLNKTALEQEENVSLNLKKNEEILIRKAMDNCNQVQLHAAKLLGISPYSLNRKLKKMNMEPVNQNS